jgi:hypothetical protein
MGLGGCFIQVVNSSVSWGKFFFWMGRLYPVLCFWWWCIMLCLPASFLRLLPELSSLLPCFRSCLLKHTQVDIPSLHRNAAWDKVQHLCKLSLAGGY